MYVISLVEVYLLVVICGKVGVIIGVRLWFVLCLNFGCMILCLVSLGRVMFILKVCFLLICLKVFGFVFIFLGMILMVLVIGSFVKIFVGMGFFFGEGVCCL